MDERGSVEIRRIRADEGLVLRELRLRSLAESPEAFGQTLDEARAQPAETWHQRARRSAAGDGQTWLLALIDDGFAGIVQGRRRRPATLLLFSMWIEPRARHRGLGSRLIADVERWGLDWGAVETLLWVYTSNAPAIAFYEVLGFGRIVAGEDHELGAQFGAIAMRRDIDPDGLGAC